MAAAHDYLALHWLAVIPSPVLTILMIKSFFRQVAGFLLTASLAMPAAAQQLQNYEVNYNNGKVLLQQQRYDRAMAELLPVTTAAATNDYAPEAAYLYALAALKAGKQQDAMLMLGQLKQQHAQWAGMPEADYLLANVQFERKEFGPALATLQDLKSTSLTADAEGLKRYYLNSITDRSSYEPLLKAHPNDKVVAQVYADKLIAGWYKPQDRIQLENLVSKFNLDRKRYLSADARSKQGFQVAVLLPFQLNQDLGQTARKNQFVTDMYAGMQLAQDSLQKQGINLKLFSYDAGTDTAAVKKVLNLQR
jgi:hypothetical protein